MKGLCRIALAALFVAACGRDSAITGLDESTVPNAPLSGGGILALGVDSVTGASIETNRDDYHPGEVVHLVGRGWAAGETINLHMIEDPNTHADVDTNVVADAAGGFTLHFYDVQVHDIGVTFTLTATGMTSGSRAVATFYDGTISLATIETRDGASCTSALSTVTAGVSICAFSSFTIAGGGTTHAQFRWKDPSGSVVEIDQRTPSFPGGTSGIQTYSATAVPMVAGTWTVLLCESNNGDMTLGGCAGPSQRASQTFTVIEANSPPILTDIPNQSVNEGSALSFTATASDTDTPAQTLTFSLIGAPAGATIGSSSGVFSWTPTDGPAQSTSFIVRVTDNGTPAMFDQQTVNVTVNNVAPTATFNAPSSVNGGSPINISLTAPGDVSTVDAGSPFTYAFDCGSGYGSFTSTNSASCPTSGTGSVTVKGRIKDKDNGEREYTTVVTLNNVAPIANVSNATFSGDEGSSIAISGSGSDPDGGSVSFAWTVTGSACTITHPNANSANASVSCNDEGTWSLTLTVTDDEGASSTANAALNVANVAPAITLSTTAAVLNEGGTFTRSGSFSDPGTDSWTATVDYGEGAGPQPLSLSLPAKTFSLNHVYPQDGSFTITVTVNDGDGGTDSESISVTVNNVAPELSLGVATATLNEGSTFSRAGSFTDPGADTWTATVNYGEGGGAQPLTLNADKTFNLSHVYLQDGSFTVTVNINDGDGGTDTETIAVTVNNVLPVVSALSGASINEGGAYSTNGSFTDPGADSWTATVNYGDGSGTQALALSGKNFSLNHTYADDDGSPFTVTVTVNDDDGSGSSQATVIVLNVAPTITTPLTMPASPVAMGSNFSMSWTFTDPGSDSWTCKISWDQPVAFGTPFASSGNTCTISGASLAAGVYTVTVYVEDDDGGSDQETATTYIVVYDPNGGFVTGGGWINSLAGYYRLNTAAEGKANFGFVSKYQPGRTVPTGNTEFQFHAGSLNFKSTSYEWLVVAGAKAMYKGEGTISGLTGVYGFLLSAIDGSPDKFRIKIWEKTTENVVYDTLADGAADDADPATTLGGGSIVVHTKK